MGVKVDLFLTHKLPQYCSNRGLQFPILKENLLKHTNRNIISKINFVFYCKTTDVLALVIKKTILKDVFKATFRILGFITIIFFSC